MQKTKRRTLRQVSQFRVVYRGLWRNEPWRPYDTRLRSYMEACEDVEKLEFTHSTSRMYRYAFKVLHNKLVGKEN